MASRPRCRDWTALITQQLRLRNLIQISGHNIVCTAKASVYYTLHPTTMSAPCYTSAKSPTPSNAIWPEINCGEFLTSTALSVCIRVWQHTAEATADGAVDTLLFLWSVCFSGLVPISKRTDVRLQPNALVFHIHGGFFTSAACLQPASLLEQLAFVVGQRRQPPPEAEEAISSAAGRPSQTPHGDSDASVTVATDPNTLKLRYIERKFYATEIRTSYSVDKLQLLQRKQRQLKKNTAATQAIRAEICARSAYCMDRPATVRAAGTGSPAAAHQSATIAATAASTPLTLSRLLNAQPVAPRPEVLWRAQQVRRQLETARFRSELLRHERGEALARTAVLQKRLARLNDANIEQESELLSNYYELRRERDSADEMRSIVGTQVMRVRWMREAVRQRQHQQLRELAEVFSIEATTTTTTTTRRTTDEAIGGGCPYTINGLMLPNAEDFADQTSPSALSVALGWAAHLTVMAAIVLDVPLRNAVRLNGSASRIRDDVKELPDADREFPLFCRSSPPPMSVRYACFLLNQNIGQLLVWLGHTTIDCRETLLNLLKLMNSQRILCRGVPPKGPAIAAQSVSPTKLSRRLAAELRLSGDELEVADDGDEEIKRGNVSLVTSSHAKRNGDQ